ncbi:MAG: hypothetical protein JW990_14810, partial [Thermoleophilia bacterium]|nr:hypothetical protein [Thermoleophilia bacterium]
MTVVRRISLGYAGVLVLVLAMVVVGVAQLWPLQSDIKDYSDSTRTQVEAASTIAESSAGMQNAVLISVVSYEQTVRDEASTALESEATAARRALDSVSSLKEVTPEAQASVASLRGLLEQYYTAASEAVAIGQTKSAEALTKVRQEVIPLGRQLDEATGPFKELVSAYETAEVDRLAGSVGRTWLIMLILAAFVVAGGIAFAVRISQAIKKQLRTAVAGINKSATELLAISTQVSAGAAQTAASTNETTATVEEVKQTALLAQEKAAQVAENSDNVTRVAEVGQATVEETISGIERMQNQMGVVAETIRRLSEQTQAIDDIITTVNDIAEQSNLLSVNASIEAAKAG